MTLPAGIKIETLAPFADRAAQTFEPGDIVRLDEYVGTKAQQKMLWRVTEVRSGTGGTQVSIEPVTGGRGLRANPVQLRPASPAEVAAANNVPTAPKVQPGTVVTLQGKVGTFVVTALSTAGTCSISPLGGGRGYTKVAPIHLTIVTGTVDVPVVQA